MAPVYLAHIWYDQDTPISCWCGFPPLCCTGLVSRNALTVFNKLSQRLHGWIPNSILPRFRSIMYRVIGIEPTLSNNGKLRWADSWNIAFRQYRGRPCCWFNMTGWQFFAQTPIVFDTIWVRVSVMIGVRILVFIQTTVACVTVVCACVLETTCVPTQLYVRFKWCN